MTFEQFYRDNYGKVLGYLVHRVESLATAEDIAQDVFLGLFKRWEVVESPTYYVYQSAKNRASDWWRRLNRHGGIRFAAQLNEQIIPVTMDMDRALYLDWALGVLCDSQRDMMITRYHDGFSIADAAQEYGVTEGAAKALVYRAKNRMRGVVDRAGGRA